MSVFWIIPLKKIAQLISFLIHDDGDSKLRNWGQDTRIFFESDEKFHKSKWVEEIMR